MKQKKNMHLREQPKNAGENYNNDNNVEFQKQKNPKKIMKKPRNH